MNSANQDLALAATNGFSYDSATHTAKWTLAAPLTRDKYLIALEANTIVDVPGSALDGEWTTSVSTYATSGNGAAGGDLYFRFNYLPGDVTLNGITNTSDVGVLRGTGTAVPTSTNFRLDVTASNLINTSDVGVVRGLGTLTLAGLPEPTVPPPPRGGTGQLAEGLAAPGRDATIVVSSKPSLQPIFSVAATVLTGTARRGP